MTIPSNREVLDDGSGQGSRVRGVAQQVINPAGTTRLLLVGESGALCIFGNAAGQIFNLPVISASKNVGMYFDFGVTITGTSNSYTLNTGSGANFIGGGIFAASTTAGDGDFFPATIASTVAMTLDADVDGRLLGACFRLTAISTTEWYCGGFTVSTPAALTPWS